jgi:bile acid:Na+ symporter, BASS family
VLKSADAALAPAIFGPWMNISGSILASWWRRCPVPIQAPTSTVQVHDPTVASKNESLMQK